MIHHNQIDNSIISLKIFFKNILYIKYSLNLAYLDNTDNGAKIRVYVIVIRDNIQRLLKL